MTCQIFLLLTLSSYNPPKSCAEVAIFYFLLKDFCKIFIFENFRQQLRAVPRGHLKEKVSQNKADDAGKRRLILIRVIRFIL